MIESNAIPALFHDEGSHVCDCYGKQQSTFLLTAVSLLPLTNDDSQADPLGLPSNSWEPVVYFICSSILGNTAAAYAMRRGAVPSPSSSLSPVVQNGHILGFVLEGRLNRDSLSATLKYT